MQTVEGLVSLAAAGGGFAVDANNCLLEDLIRIAAAGSGKQAQLVRIAAGKGCVNSAVLRKVASAPLIVVFVFDLRQLGLVGCYCL